MIHMSVLYKKYSNVDKSKKNNNEINRERERERERTYPAGVWCQNDVVLTSMQRDYVASTLIRRHFRTKCPLGNNGPVKQPCLTKIKKCEIIV